MTISVPVTVICISLFRVPALTLCLTPELSKGSFNILVAASPALSVASISISLSVLTGVILSMLSAVMEGLDTVISALVVKPSLAMFFK